MMTDARGMRVVVADSDRTVLELLQIRLDIAGYHTSVARTGPAALEMLKHIRPGALIIDRALADMSGFEVLRAFSKRGEKLPFPTLVTGRKLGLEDVQMARGLGARDCMAKPFSGADVLERLARMLRAAKSERERNVHPGDDAPGRRSVYAVD